MQSKIRMDMLMNTFLNSRRKNVTPSMMEESQNDKNETTLESKSIERSSICAILKSFIQQTQH